MKDLGCAAMALKGKTGGSQQKNESKITELERKENSSLFGGKRKA